MNNGDCYQLPEETSNFIFILRQHLPEISRKYSVSYLGIFGSYVRGEQESENDLDILVEFEEDPSFFEYIRLEDYLSEILVVKVDLVMKSALKPAIGKHILDEVVAV